MRFLLFFLIVFFSGFCAKAQQLKAREIVNLALKKHARGKVIKQYEVRTEFNTLGKTSSALIQPDPFLKLIDSMMVTLPDSQRKEMKTAMVQSNKDMLKEIESMYHGQKEINFVDLLSDSTAYIVIRPNTLRGKPDTTRNVYAIKKQHLLGSALINNPVTILQFMSNDSTELHYTGIINLNNAEYHVIQAKFGEKWVDVYFDQNYYLSKLIIPQTDTDPLTGREPVHYKNIFSYNKYQKQGDFFLPGEMEEMSSRDEFSIKKNITWVSLNKPFPASTFNPEPSYEDRVQYTIFEIGQDLYVLEESTTHQRSLIKRNRNRNIQMFAEPNNIDSWNKKQMNTLKSKFHECQISDIFSITSLSGFVSLSSFLSKNTHIYVPKEAAFMEEQSINLYGNAQEDSIHKDLFNKGLFTIFDAEFKTNGVQSIVLNPVRKDKFDRTFVVYYLPDEKVIYMYGNPYSADSSSKNALPREKIMYDLIKERSLPVDKIVYSGSYLDNAQLFMTFKDFESRINNTDFSVYDRDKR